MNFENRPLIKPKDTIKTLSAEEIAAIKKNEQDQDLQSKLRQEKALENREKMLQRRAGIKRVVEEKNDIQKNEIVPELISEPIELVKDGSAKKELTIVGKIDLEKIHTKKIASLTALIHENEKNTEDKTVHQHKEKIFNIENLDELYKQAVTMLGDNEVHEHELLEKFTKIHGIEKIKQDIYDIAIIEKKIEIHSTPETIKTKKVATILEAIMATGIVHKKFEWLGEGVKIQVPPRIDEVKKGVDAILEFIRTDAENDFLALGIDITFSNIHSDGFHKKINNILNGIDRNKVTELEYFQDENDEPVVGLKMPKVIFSIRADQIEDLVNIWGNRKLETYKKRFKDHHIKFYLVEQIISQCEIFATYATKKGFLHIANLYRDVIGIAKKIQKKSFEIPGINIARGKIKPLEYELELIINNHEATEEVNNVVV